MKKIIVLIFMVFALLLTYYLEANAKCTDGGPGSSECSVTWSVLGGLFSGGCSTSCKSGYYACCNKGDSKCTCEIEKPSREIN